MNYEEKYNQALERARIEYKNEQSKGNIWVCENLSTIFPELKENEDEKIRRALLELVRQSSEVLDKQNQNNMITWLEKQGEKSWSEEDKEMILDTIKAFQLAYPFATEEENPRKRNIDWLKSIKDKVQPQSKQEPNHWKPSEEQMEALLYALGKDGIYNHKALTKLYNDLKNL